MDSAPKALPRMIHSRHFKVEMVGRSVGRSVGGGDHPALITLIGEGGAEGPHF